MQLVSKVTLATFDFKKHLMIDFYRTLPHAILANIFLVSDALQLFHSLEGS